MTFVYSILIIFITVLLLGVMIIAKVLRTIFGIGRKMTGQSGEQNNAKNQSDYTYQENSEQSNVPNRHKKKVFEKNEGEYIEFEEIKD